MKVFLAHGSEKLDLSIRTNEVQPSLPPYTNSTVKWIIDSNIKAKTIKLLEEHIGEHPYNLGQARLLEKDTEGSSVKEKKLLNQTSSK